MYVSTNFFFNFIQMEEREDQHSSLNLTTQIRLGQHILTQNENSIFSTRKHIVKNATKEKMDTFPVGHSEQRLPRPRHAVDGAAMPPWTGSRPRSGEAPTCYREEAAGPARERP
jgi:hypothetical protein